MFPTEFEQIYIQLFWKGTAIEQSDERIINAFKEMESKKYFLNIQRVIKKVVDWRDHIHTK